jgi:glutaredoxin
MDLFKHHASSTTHELVMYARSFGCPYQDVAARVLADRHVTYRTIMIDEDLEARDRVVAWTGFRSVPTIVAALPGEVLPYQEPEPLPSGASPRGVNRGPMITEATEKELVAWLKQEGFI